MDIYVPPLRSLDWTRRRHHRERSILMFGKTEDALLTEQRCNPKSPLLARKQQSSVEDAAI